MSKLALIGGTPVRETEFPPYPVIRERERQAVQEVLDEGRLSTFIASPGDHFLGGERIRAFEAEFAEYHGVDHAVAFNSATAALHAAVVGVGVDPGEEVITTPYTFTSTATCALMHNAIPVFADVEDDTFCINPEEIRSKITERTSAIIPVHLFGQPAALDEILEIGEEHGIPVIEDCAQAPGSTYHGTLVGTLGDCGVFSFQETKNMMTGEGGMLITDDEEIAEAARLVRNHGEAVAHTYEERSYASEILGYNYRMTEFEAAIGRVQLESLDEWNTVRADLADHLTNHLRDIPGIEPPQIRNGCTHVYYVYPFLFDAEEAGIPRNLFAEALQEEGIPLGVGYVRPLHLAPIFQTKNAFAFRNYEGHAGYAKGSLPVSEDLHENRLLFFPMVRPPATPEDMDDVIHAVEKVIDAREDLLFYAERSDK